MLVHASELGGLELGGKRNSLDVEITQLWRLVALLRTLGRSPQIRLYVPTCPCFPTPSATIPRSLCCSDCLLEALAFAQALFIRQDNALDTKGKIKGWLWSLAAAGSRRAVSDVVSC